MKQRTARNLMISIALIIASILPQKILAEEEKNNASTDVFQAYWVFSGAVTNENGEHYDYYFQMQRKDTQFHALTTLIDSQTKTVLLYEEGDATIEHVVASNWHVGDMFMHFNPINNSWVFGVKTKDQKGFNFKVDMLGQTQPTPLTHDLHFGVELFINQTGRLNGHLQTGKNPGKEEFITASKAWFKQVWVSKPQNIIHPLTEVLCQFDDGSGFYAVNSQEPHSLRGAVAEWRDGQEIAASISRVVSIKERENGLWSVQIPSPRVRLSLQDILVNTGKKARLIAGPTKGDIPGFCTISKDDMSRDNNESG